MTQLQKKIMRSGQTASIYSRTCNTTIYASNNYDTSYNNIAGIGSFGSSYKRSEPFSFSSSHRSRSSARSNGSLVRSSSRDIIRPSTRSRTPHSTSSRLSPLNYDQQKPRSPVIKQSLTSSYKYNPSKYTAMDDNTDFSTRGRSKLKPEYDRNNNCKSVINGGCEESFSKLSIRESEKLPGANGGKVGLKNIGNTCFMNSIVQCLANTKKLRDYCLKKKFTRDRNYDSQMKGKLIEAFATVLDEIWNSSNTSFSPQCLKTQIQKYSSRFSGYDQHDSQEFLHFLLEGLHQEINRCEKKKKQPIPDKPHWSEEQRSDETWRWYKSYDNSFIVDLFVGQLRSSLTCTHCGHVSTIFDLYWDLSLPIPKMNRYSTESVNIAQCLQDFTRPEELDGNERPTCEKCKTRRRMIKKFTIYSLPPILVLHLKRFNEGTSYRQKLSTNVKFPMQLEFCDESIAVPETVYDLYAVSNHSGSCYGGHYTANCKIIDTEEWYHFNDSLVTSISKSTVQSKEAYVLFYEKRDSSYRSRSHL